MLVPIVAIAIIVAIVSFAIAGGSASENDFGITAVAVIVASFALAVAFVSGFAASYQTRLEKQHTKDVATICHLQHGKMENGSCIIGTR